jgi:hypothetical protein
VKQTTLLGFLVLASLLSTGTIISQDVDKSRALSHKKLEQMALGMIDYHAGKINKMPAHAIYDAAGKKSLLSWRVAILPYIKQEKLFKKFHLDESWNSEHNISLLNEMPGIYEMPGVDSKPGLTHYQVFTMPPFDPGENKRKRFMPVFSLSNARISLGQIVAKDGTDHTITITEATVPVEWTKPQDLNLDHDDAPLPSLGIRAGTDEFLAVSVSGKVFQIRRDAIRASEANGTVFKQLIGWKDMQKGDLMTILK